MYLEHDDMNNLWIDALVAINERGVVSAPRQQMTREITGLTLCLTDTLNNILTIPERRLNYSFMVAEWFWIARGADDVESIAFYNKEIARFSDDGKSYYGAYGPRFREQWDYVKSKLIEDPVSRQAVLTTWRPNPPGTRDVPCTVSTQYMIRDKKLIAGVTMRSSDAWLGLPYDMFNFTRMQALMACELGIEPGKLVLHMGSSHLYAQHFEPSAHIVETYVYNPERWMALPASRSPVLVPVTPQYMSALEVLARTLGKVLPEAVEDKPWGDYAEALALRMHKDYMRGDGHMMRLIRQVKKLNHTADMLARGRALKSICGDDHNADN